MSWIPIKEERPEVNVLVALINVDKEQNDPAGRYPVARIGCLSPPLFHRGVPYWRCYGYPGGLTLEYFTPWCELPPIPWGDEE